ncbi:MAG: cyclase family protein [Candidatus Promineifilaceae bacterium]|nr:cyclase family protein [Candidatus Promineifilaceae bacterium]
MQDRIIDISRTLSTETAVWPGDTPFQLLRVMSREKGDSVNLTTITISAHTGTHVDAPIHYTDRGATMEAVELRPFWGLAQVVTISKTSGPLSPTDFSQFDLSLAPRLLVRTPVGAIPISQFPEEIPYPTPELADHLGGLGICLYGTDAPSMDNIHSETLPGHKALLRNRIAILESLDLSRAADELYEICAMPLKIAGGDGSPVRAVLRTL